MAWTKDHLNHQKRQLIESTKLDSELSMISPTTQPSVMTSSIVAQPPCDKEGGSTETRPTLAHTLMATFSWGTSMTQLPMTYTNKVAGEWGPL